MMIYITAFQVLVFVTYVSFIWKRFGVLNSISESYYVLSSDSKLLSLNGMFTIFCILISFPFFFHSREFHPELATEQDLTFLFFLPMLLSFTGVAADFKREISNVIHFAAVSVAVISAFAGLWLQYSINFPAIACILVTVLILLFGKHKIWWIEINCFSWIMLGLIYLCLI